jgi:tRNA threonylcarbamoyladenosine biosynthesis protein TsaB
MTLVVLDTSTERGVIGVAARSGMVFTATTDAARQHGRDLLPTLAATLKSAGLALKSAELFAVGLGPGSYTGLRVGLTAAKTVAYATGAPVVGLDSLAAVARNAPADAVRISVVADAQRGELYVAEFSRQAPGAPLICMRVSQIEPLAAWLARLEATTFVLGPALNSPRIQAALPAWLTATDPALNYPDGHRLVELAREAWASGQRDDPWLLEPRYLRRSAAEEQWDSRNPPRPR